MVRLALLVTGALRAAAREDTDSLLQVAAIEQFETSEHVEASQQFLPSFMQCLSECLPSTSAAKKSEVEWFENERIHQNLPLPSEDLQYPPQLEGIIWMDQAGFLGHSDVPSAAAAPDGCFSFGDTQFSTLQRNADDTIATINVDTSGPAWQWFNNAKGYLFYKTLSKIGFHYHFQFTDNYKHAQILGTAQPPMMPGFSPPPGFLNFTMDYQSAYLDENLCPRTASPEVLACVGVDMDIDDVEGVNCARVRREITRCAKWKRVSNVVGGAPLDYYAYEIVDRNGNPRQPYFDMYLKWINKNTNPSSLAAYAFGLNGNAEEKETSFRGKREDTGGALESSGNDIFGPCRKCISPDGLPMLTTANGIGIDYIKDMLSLANKDYTDSWCDGQIAGCAEKKEFPGKLVTSIMGYEAVTNLTRLTPEKEWSGEWWRGGELGYIINNPIFWMGSGINPPAIGLGHTPKQHAVIRPYVEKAFELEQWKRADRAAAFQTVDRMIHDFLEKKKTAKQASDRKISAPTDLKILVHQILNKVSLQRDVTWEYAADFVALQSKVVAMGTLSQVLPSAIYQNCDPQDAACLKVRDYLEDIQKGVVRYVDEYERVWRDKGLEAKLKPLDAECAPSDSCLRQLAAGTWDALYAAGGLSVPTNLAVGLGVLFSEHESNPFLDSKHTFSPEDNAMEFALEVIRYFPSVVGFPHWEVRPTCEGLSAEETAELAAPDGCTKPCPWDKDGRDGKPNTVNQYQGGLRVVPNLGLAQRDPAVWGPDSEKFVIRSHAEYAKSVGFAEPAWRPEFMNGAMNRNCPGKTLAIHIDSSFFKQLKLDEWYVDGEGPKITSGPRFVEAFELKHSSWKAAEYDASRVWIPQPDFSGKVAMDREFVPIYPQESFVSIPMAKNGISIEVINEVEHVVFPTDHQLKDILGVRSTHTELWEDASTQEFGDLRWMGDFQDPDYSPIPGNIFAFIEKFFVYEYDGPWHPTEEAKTAEEARQEPPEVTNGTIERAAKVLQYLHDSSFDSTRLAAAFDPLAAADLKFYVDYRQPRASPEDRSKMHAMKERLNQGRARVATLPKGTAPKSVSTSCVHFLKHKSVIMDEENKVVKFPLGFNLPVFRGQSVFSPRYYTSTAIGHGFFTKDGPNLLWYHGASSYGAFEIQRENIGTSAARYTYRIPPKLYISEAGGAGMPSPAQAMDLRATEHNPADHHGRLVNFQDDIVDTTDHRHQLFLRYATLPLSYAFLYQNAEAACAPHFEHIASRVQHSDYRTLAQEGMTVAEGEALRSGLLEALLCGHSLMRGAADYSNGIDSLELFVFQHFAMDWPTVRRFHGLRGDEHLHDGWHWDHHVVFGEAAPLPDDPSTPC